MLIKQLISHGKTPIESSGLSYSFAGDKRKLLKHLMTQTFEHPKVRDLAWVIASPSMIQAQIAHRPVFSDKDCAKAYSKTLARLQKLEEDPAPLLSYLEQLKSHRVGQYFEALTHYWLKHLTDVEIIANNLQLKEGNQTLGEMDFLFREDEKLLHWEVAVKYYLQLAPDCEEHEYIGPNTADNLTSKIERLFEKQLPRSTEKNLVRALGTLDGSCSIKRQAFVKGWLFYRGYPETFGNCPSSINTDHLKGFWIHQGEDKLPTEDQGSLWALLEKPYWLAPKLSTTTDGLMTREQLEALLESHFNDKKSPLLVAQLKPCASGYLERFRGFVVSSQWPN